MGGDFPASSPFVCTVCHGNGWIRRMRFLKRTAHNAAAQDKFGAKLIIPKLKQLLLQRTRFIERTEEIADFGKHEPR